MPGKYKKLVHDADTTFDLTGRFPENDITGWTFTLTLSEPGLKEALFTYPGAINTVTSPHAVVFNIAPTETVKWDLGKYAYRIDYTKPGGTVKRFMFGPLDVKSGVDV